MKFHTQIVFTHYSSGNDRYFEVIFCALRCVSFFAGNAVVPGICTVTGLLGQAASCGRQGG
jgi:hypothetical protein